jgi:hypothetical protein
MLLAWNFASRSVSLVLDTNDETGLGDHAIRQSGFGGCGTCLHVFTG